MLSTIMLLIGTTELVVIGGAILLFFGGKKIPELMKSMGQGVKSFKDGMREGLPDDDTRKNGEEDTLVADSKKEPKDKENV